MPQQIPISDFRSLDETNRSLIIWQGLTDTWSKLQEVIEKQDELDSSSKVHQKLLITGNGEPSVMERIRNLEKFEERFQYWARFLGGAMLLNFLGFLAATIIAIVRFLPLLEKLASP